MPMKVKYTVLSDKILSENRGGIERGSVPDSLGNTVALLDCTQTQTETTNYWRHGEVD